MNYVSQDDMKKIMRAIAKKTPQGLMQGDTAVGHITWQMYLMDDYLKLDGSSLTQASVKYPELLAFAIDNGLVTSTATNIALFKYNSGTDVLTLPDFMDKSLWSGSTVEEKDAGLPNIVGGNDYSGSVFRWNGPNDVMNIGAFKFAARKYYVNPLEDTSSFNEREMVLSFDASLSNPIYGNSTTVQPPAIQLIPQIKYKRSTTVWETVDIGRFVATAPAYYEREDIFTIGKTTITLPPCWVNIDGKGYVLSSSKIIDITQSGSWDDGQYATASNRAGKDFYIYAVKPVGSTNEPTFILSHNSTVPTGYTATNSRKIGGFHCLCASVGSITGHTLTGYVEGDILSRSAWDLQHRAVSDNEGMVWCPEIDKWVDIYLSSWDGSGLASVYGGTIADGASSPSFHGERFAEYLGLRGKSLLSRDEFSVVAKGSNEGTNIYSSVDPVTTGGHTDTASRRMVSNYGLEDCCGAVWQVSKDCPEFYPGATWASSDKSLQGYSWQGASVYDSGIDTQQYGEAKGLLRRLMLGGDRSSGSKCGSRAVLCDTLSAGGSNAYGARGASAMRR